MSYVASCCAVSDAAALAKRISTPELQILNAYSIKTNPDERLIRLALESDDDVELGMRLRRVPPGTVVTARISAVKAGLQISIDELESHFLAGGNVVRSTMCMLVETKLIGGGATPSWSIKT